MKKIIDMITSTRADFGLLLPLIRRLVETKTFDVRLLVTGSHLVPELGDTIKEIEASGIPIYGKYDILGVGRSMPQIVSHTVSVFSEEFRLHTPDMVVILGDRYEIFAVATAAAMNDIPIAHISGGETTEGAKDEYFRHCITKMSYLHFTATEDYRKRVIQLGESPERVINSGALGVENIRSLVAQDVNSLSEELGMDLSKPFLLCTVHPETMGCNKPLHLLNSLTKAIECLSLPCLFTASNTDPGGDEINQALKEFCRKHPNSIFIPSLGLRRYLSVMRLCAVVCGNSSSAITESTILRIPAVNIGDRQKGRFMANNIFCCRADSKEVKRAIQTALSVEFKNSLSTMNNPFGDGNTSAIICDVLQKSLTSTIDLRKTFYDIRFEVTV